MKKSWAWVNRQVMPLEEAAIPLSSAGFLLGDGVFETLRARRGKIFRENLHRARLACGLDVLGIDPGVLDTATAALHAVCESATPALDDVYLRVQVVREPSAGEQAAGSVTALARPCPVYPAHWFGPGVRLAISTLQIDPGAPLAGVKSLSYLPQVLARRQAQATGFDDALILNTEGRVCEAAHANVIARTGRVVYAPGREEGALNGVTRHVLLEWTREAGYEYETRLPCDVLAEADEAVLTSTLAGVVPVASIDSFPEAHLAGSEGAMAKEMRTVYETLLHTG